jgi:alpha-L-arabinofuranosidase
VPLDELEPYVQDALDLIEFANGAVSTTWGRVRAEMGHPAPFGLKMIGIGNEQWGPQYFERYEIFARAIRAKYPEVKLVTSAGPTLDDERYTLAWETIPKLPADIVDEHRYAEPEWFLNNTARFDHQDRQGARIFMGEYAAHEPNRKNTWRSAVTEAAFLTGLERNADVVVMSSYAPLFAHVDAWQWSPNLIWFDNLRAAGTTNYLVQRLFGTHRGDRSLPIRVEHAPLAENGQPRLYASAQVDDGAHELILKFVNATDAVQPASVELGGATVATASARSLVVVADPAAENTLDAPHQVAAKEGVVSNVSTAFSHDLPAWSLTILRVPLR